MALQRKDLGNASRVQRFYKKFVSYIFLSCIRSSFHPSRRYKSLQAPSAENSHIAPGGATVLFA